MRIFRPVFAGVLLVGASWLVGCNQPPLIPAPPDTGPALEALQLSQGLLAPERADGEPAEPMRIEDRLAHYRVPGVSIAVIEGGELRWAKAWGVVRAGSEDAVTPSTLFQASSITKALTAVVALGLVEAGELELDRDLAGAIDGWSPSTPTEGITLRRLLSHTAGIGPQSFAGYAPGEAVPTAEQILRGEPPAVGEPIDVVHPPGTVWQYSGGGYQLVQHLLARTEGKPFAELMEERLFDPLEMDRTTFTRPDGSGDPSDVAVAHDAAGEPLPGGFRVYPESAAAGAWSTATDLAHWLIDLQKAHAGKPGRRLKRDSVREAFSPQAPGDWGLGFQLGGSGQARRFSHVGGNAGFPAVALGFVSSGHGAVILTNGDGGHDLIPEIVTGLAKIYGWPSLQQRISAPQEPSTPAETATEPTPEPNGP